MFFIIVFPHYKVTTITPPVTVVLQGITYHYDSYTCSLAPTSVGQITLDQQDVVLPQ